MTRDPAGEAAGELALAGASLVDGRQVDVRLAGGKIVLVQPAAGPATGQLPATDQLPAAATDRGPVALALHGWLLLPAPAEPHAHLDKALTADLVDNPAGDLGGAIAAWLAHRPSLTHDDIVARATTALRLYVSHGATAIRSHVDIGATNGLRALQAMLVVREAVRDWCALQLVAFVGVPLTGVAGATHRALLREAVDAGADVVGGCPYLDPDPAGCVARCLAVAADHQLPLDLHVDETLDPAARTLAMLADAVEAAGGHPYGVAASHCVSLGAQPPSAVRQLADRLARCGINVICNPQTNLFLQGRDRTVPGAAGRPRGLAPLELLRAAGVTVAAGGDNLQDPFNPMGRADPLETAALLVLAGHLVPDAAYQAVSGLSRAALGLAPVTVQAGAPAELLAIRASPDPASAALGGTGSALTLRAAIAGASPERVVIHAGRVVATTSLTRTFPRS